MGNGDGDSCFELYKYQFDHLCQVTNCLCLLRIFCFKHLVAFVPFNKRLDRSVAVLCGLPISTVGSKLKYLNCFMIRM
jgi:hypothetical protein